MDRVIDIIYLIAAVLIAINIVIAEYGLAIINLLVIIMLMIGGLYEQK